MLQAITDIIQLVESEQKIALHLSSAPTHTECYLSLMIVKPHVTKFLSSQQITLNKY